MSSGSAPAVPAAYDDEPIQRPTAVVGAAVTLFGLAFFELLTAAGVGLLDSSVQMEDSGTPSPSAPIVQFMGVLAAWAVVLALCGVFLLLGRKIAWLVSYILCGQLLGAWLTAWVAYVVEVVAAFGTDDPYTLLNAGPLSLGCPVVFAGLGLACVVLMSRSSVRAYLDGRSVRRRRTPAVVGTALPVIGATRLVGGGRPIAVRLAALALFLSAGIDVLASGAASWAARSWPPVDGGSPPSTRLVSGVVVLLVWAGASVLCGVGIHRGSWAAWVLSYVVTGRLLVTWVAARVFDDMVGRAWHESGLVLPVGLVLVGLDLACLVLLTLPSSRGHVDHRAVGSVDAP